MKDFHICILNANVENGLYTGLSYSVNLLYVSVKFVKAKSCLLLYGYKNLLITGCYTVILTKVCGCNVNMCYVLLFFYFGFKVLTISVLLLSVLLRMVKKDSSIQSKYCRLNDYPHTLIAFPIFLWSGAFEFFENFVEVRLTDKTTTGSDIHDAFFFINIQFPDNRIDAVFL